MTPMPCDVPTCTQPYVIRIGLPMEGIGPYGLCDDHSHLEPEAIHAMRHA